MKLTSLSNMLKKLRLVEQKLTKEFEITTGFSITRYEIFTFLKERWNKVQVDITKHPDINPATITEHIKILETKGYITKNENNERDIIIGGEYI